MRDHSGRLVALAGMTVACAVGFLRVFDTPSFLVPLLLTVVAGHAMAVVTRRLSRVASALSMLVVGVLVSVDVSHWSSTTLGIPTKSTYDAIIVSLDSARSVVVHGSAPTTPSAGLLLVSAAALWLAAWSADRLNFRFRTPVEAAAPSVTIFLVVTLLAGPDHRWLAAGLYGLSVAVHLLIERAAAQSDELERAKPGGGGSVLRMAGVGTLMAGTAITFGLGAAAALPVFTNDGVLPIRNNLRDGPPRSAVSPLVDIRSRLVEQQNHEMFRVRSSAPAYWRLMVLDEFDGTVWSADQSYSGTGSHLASDGDTTPGNVPSKRLEATYDLTGLDGPWAPAAFRPTALRGTDALLWDPAGSTLIARASVGSVYGLRYTITSEIPEGSVSTMASGDEPIPDDVRRTDLQLPDDYPASLRRIARRITADATSDYEKALALQNYFRNNFTYSTDVEPGESLDAIDSFLRDRKGFCEQFAGTYAAFARSIGLPTRVAVGFTPGSPTADGYLVRGRDAHAWPEVYLGGQGWLAFEPTPGRGNPNASSYTGVQPGLLAPPTSPPTTAANTGPGTTVEPGDPAPPTTAPSASREATPPASGTDGSPNSSNWPPRWVIAVLAALLLACTPSFIRGYRRIRRRRLAVTAADRILTAWNETLEAWRPLQLVRHDSDTDRDLGNRLAARLENLGHPDADVTSARRLAAQATAAAWNPPGATDADRVDARATAEELERVARSHRSRFSKLVGWFDPGIGVRRYSRKRSRNRSC